MNIYRFSRYKTSWCWCGLIIFLIIYLITSRLLASHPSESATLFEVQDLTIIDHKQRLDCDSFNPDVNPKQLFQSFFSILNDSSWLAAPTSYSPSFKQLHGLLFGSEKPNLYETWPNYFNKKLDLTYKTHLSQSLFTKILLHSDIPITFAVEVGSFMGMSTINIAKTLIRDTSRSKPVILCIDTWLGGLEHWSDSSLRNVMGIAYGRPIVYEQFIATIIANELTDYVIPFSTTSLLGARFLLEHKLFPQIIYLDSAHLQGETYVELELFWSLLEPGGILFGDDWTWHAVRCDVIRFIDTVKTNVTILGNTWFIKKKKFPTKSWYAF